MGDDATIHARMLSPISIGHHPSRLGDANGTTGNDKRLLLTELVNDIHRKNSSDKPKKEEFLRKLGDGFSTSGGTELVRKKSYHPELRTDKSDDPNGKMEFCVLSKDSSGNQQHKMELIHLNRTCTSVNVMAPSLPSTAQVRMISSDANLTDEEKMHKVCHQVSFAHPTPEVSHLRCEALRKSAGGRDETFVPQDEESYPFLADFEDCLDESGSEEVYQDQDFFDLSSSNANVSPDGDLDYLEVRPSLASTQLNELRGPN